MWCFSGSDSGASMTMRVRSTGIGRPMNSRYTEPAEKNGFSSRTVICSSMTAPIATAGSGPSRVRESS